MAATRPASNFGWLKERVIEGTSAEMDSTAAAVMGNSRAAQDLPNSTVFFIVAMRAPYG